MRTIIVGLLAAGIAIVKPLAVAAGPAADLVFRTGVFERIETGSRLTYSHKRAGPSAAGFREVPDGQMTLHLRPSETEEREAIVTLHQGGGMRSLHPFPTSAGNPLLMVFMESSLRSMAQITGGSPFYLRNRMRDALRNKGAVEDIFIIFRGTEVPAQRAVFSPFDSDPNRARMGLFADLTISFVVSDAVPGGFASLVAATPEGDGAYREEIVFLTTETVK